MKTVRLALDWSPNTLHAGFLLALHKGWYAEAGIELTLRSPEEDNYALTPAKQLANGLVHFGIAPTESVISYHTLSKPVPLKAVAALLQEDTSAIVTLREKGISRPKSLDGKTYASYSARFEDCIVKRLIRNDGGCGMIRTVNPDKLGIWDTLVDEKADATWVFMPWEGILAQRAGLELNAFKLGDFGIPYGYSPLLLTHESILEEYPGTVCQFLKTTGRGFRFAAEQPGETAAFLCREVKHTNFKDEDFIRESLEMLSNCWLRDGQWGLMKTEVWHQFTEWLVINRVLCDISGECLDCLSTEVQRLFTNRFLPAD